MFRDASFIDADFFAEDAFRCIDPMSSSATRVVSGASTIDSDPSDPFHAAVLVGCGDAEIVRVAAEGILGGAGDAPSASDLFCAALAASIDSALRIGAGIQGVSICALSVDVRGWTDWRAAPHTIHFASLGFQSLVCTVRLEIGDDIDAERLHAVFTHGERVATVFATLRRVLPCHLRYEVARRTVPVMPHRLAG